MGTEAGREAAPVNTPAAPARLPREAAAPKGGLPDIEGLETWAFLALTRLLEETFPDAPAFGATQDPSRERVRFRANPSLGYPAREVERIRVDADSGLVELTVNFLGLHGPSSPLPPFYTEQVIEDAADGGVLGTFLDLFNHRLVSLLVRVHKYHRHDLRYEAGARDPVSLMAAALMGLLPGPAAERRVMLMPYVGLLSCYSLSASIIAALIGHCTGLPVHIEEFVARTVTIPAPLRSRLGARAPELGGDFILGADVTDRMGKFRLVVGPLDRATFDRLLPDQPLFADVLRLLMLALKDPLAFDVRLELAPGALPALALGSGRLGWNTWLAPPAGADGAADFAADRLAASL
ncbi:type VI secretion system baseplate subunit TssG [Xanthobacter sp. V0B-10]|uniref:type VI secretion system baseplate subunit TssG n=1 Tax=Xanthobacter albus TaxID=3119929 RepID=UPI00372B4E12